MLEQQSQQSLFIELIQRTVKEDKNFIKQVCLPKNQAAIPIFRSLNSQTRNLLLRRIQIGQPTLDFYKSLIPQAEEFFKPAEQLGLVTLGCSKPNNIIDTVHINPDFAISLNQTIEGESMSIFRQVSDQICTPLEWEKECQIYWKNLFNVISQQSEEANKVGRYGKRVVQTLKESKMLVKNSDTMFLFILSSTREQINMLLKHYAEQMVNFFNNKVSDVIRFILELSVLNPEKFYQIPNDLSKLQIEILEDFKQLGFVSMNEDKKGFIRITYLLWNFLYDKPKVSIDIYCNIIVEANFRIYAYIDSQDALEADILLNLLSLFSEKKYRFPNLIIADLNQESLFNAFKRNLKAQQIIKFLEMNNRNKSQHEQIEEERKQRQKLKETQQIEIKKRLGFLRIFQDEAMSSNPILPHNVVQQLRFWEKEMIGQF